MSSKIDWGKTRQLPAGVESELVIYYEGQTWQMLEEGYRIIVAYSDILGNRYLPVSRGPCSAWTLQGHQAVQQSNYKKLVDVREAAWTNFNPSHG